MNHLLRSIHWRRHGLTALHLALQSSGWALTRGGRLLETSGKALSAAAEITRWRASKRP